MKLTVPELRKEAFEITTSIKNIKKMHNYQLELAKFDDDLSKEQGKDFAELTKANAINMIHYLESSEAFIKEQLGLSEKEVEKLEEFGRAEFDRLTNKIILIFQGYDESFIDKVFAEEDGEKDGEKKEQAPVKG